MAKSGPMSPTVGQPTERVLIVLVCALASAFVLRLFVPARDPWLDEAMLGLNIKAVAGRSISTAAVLRAGGAAGISRPVLSGSIDRAGYVLHSRGAGREPVLMIATFYLLLRLATAYGGLKAAILLAAVLLASDFILTYGVELQTVCRRRARHDRDPLRRVRPFSFDQRSLGLAVLGGHARGELLLVYRADSRRRSPRIDAGASLVARASREERGRHCADGSASIGSVAWSLCAVLTVVSVVAIKKLMTDPLTAMQFSAYSDVYNTFLNRRASIGSNAQILEWLFARIYEFMYLSTFAERHAATTRHIGMLVAAVAIIGVNVFAARKRPYLVLTSVMLFGAILTLNVAKLFPIGYTRHLLFAAPILLVPVALGTSELFEAVGRRAGALARRATTWSLCRPAGLAAFATYRTVRADKAAESRFLRDALRMDAATPVWVYFRAQPTVRLIAPPGLRFIGMLDHHSRYASWLRRAGACPKRPARGCLPRGIPTSPRSQDSVWLLFTYTDLAARPERSLNPYLAIADSVVGGCTLRSTAVTGRLYWCSNRGGSSE